MSDSLPDNLPGQTFRGRVRDLSSEGLGVVESPAGQIFFAPAAWPGDEGQFEIESLKGRYGYARMATLDTPSPDRRTPPCPHQGYVPGKCGGCPWMIGNYPSQLRAKTQRVRHALSRAGLLAGEKDEAKPSDVLRDTWASPQEFEYRNRAQFKTNGEVLGYVSTGTHTIAPIADCPILTPPLRQELRELVATLPREDYRPSPRHPWNFLEIDEEAVAERKANELAAGDLAAHPLNRRRPFRQGNGAQNQRMRDWLAQGLTQESASAHAVELYCGSGNFTELLVAQNFARITAVEVASNSLEELRARQRTQPGWQNVRCVDMDLSRRANFERLARDCVDAEILVLDPPREGAKGVEVLVRALPRLRTIFYISCDIATYTRDAAQMARAGFALVQAQPLDLFPQTAHVELLTVLRRAPLGRP